MILDSGSFRVEGEQDSACFVHASGNVSRDVCPIRTALWAFGVSVGLALHRDLEGLGLHVVCSCPLGNPHLNILLYFEVGGECPPNEFAGCKKGYD